MTAAGGRLRFDIGTHSVLPSFMPSRSDDCLLSVLMLSAAKEQVATRATTDVAIACLRLTFKTLFASEEICFCSRLLSKRAYGDIIAILFFAPEKLLPDDIKAQHCTKMVQAQIQWRNDILQWNEEGCTQHNKNLFILRRE